MIVHGHSWTVILCYYFYNSNFINFLLNKEVKQSNRGWVYLVSLTIKIGYSCLCKKTNPGVSKMGVLLSSGIRADEAG